MPIAIINKVLKRLMPATSNAVLTQRVATGIYWSVVGAMAVSLLRIIFFFIAARSLGAEYFGKIAMVLCTVDLAVLLSGLSLGIASTKFIAEFRTTDPGRCAYLIKLMALITIVFSLLISVLFWWGARWLSRDYLHAPDLYPALLGGAGLVFMTTLAAFQSGVLYGFELFKKAALINALSMILLCLIILPAIKLFHVNGVIVALCISFLVAISLNHYALRNILPWDTFQFHMIPSEMKRVLSFCIPATLGGLFVVFGAWVTNVVLTQQPSGYKEVGIFNMANQWRNIIIFMPGVMAQAYLPVLSAAYAERSKDYLRLLFSVFVITVFFSLIPAAGLLLASDVLAKAYGPSFAAAGVVIAMMGVVAVMASLSGTLGLAITSSGRMWLGFFLNLTWLVILTVSFWSWRTQGALGLTYAFGVAYTVHFILSIFLAVYLLKSMKMKSVK